MIIVISPAKALDYQNPVRSTSFSQPDFLDRSAQLIDILRAQTPARIAELMSLSDALAELNVARYAQWSRPFTPGNARQALFAFNGDVYEGLGASSLSEADLSWSQEHLRILSGLYGMLRPLDLMQAYRLEMGTRLQNAHGKDLYAFWSETITSELNHLLAAEAEAGREPVLLNLASDEYFRAVKTKQLAGSVVNTAFEDWNGGRYKIISFFAKRARGLMSRFIICNRIDDVARLRDFAAEGYAFAPDASSDERLVFRRREQ